MELFSLLAKLTLDTSEYESSLKKAESLGKNADDVEASLTLDTSEFDQAIENANEAKVDDPDEPELGLDDEEFTTGITNANDAEVDDPDDPELGLDDTEFQSTVTDAEETVVDDPESPNLGLETTDYKDALDTAESDTETWSGAIGDIFDNLKGIIAAAGITAVITGIVSSLSEAVDLARSTGDNIDKSSRAMSLSTDAYQEWQHVLDINGASVSDLNRGLMNMRKLMGGGEVSKEASEAFEKLGLSARVANGEITSTEELLDASLKALADFSGKAEDRDVLAQALFGRGGTKLNAMFDGTSEDIDALKQQAHDLGLVMSEEAVANAAAYNDAVTNMQQSMESFKIALGEQILPLLTDVTNKVAAIIAFFNPRTWNSSLADQFKGVDDELAENLLDIEATSGAAEKMIDKLFSMGDATKLTAEKQAEWKATAKWLKENIPSLSEVIDTDTLSITANKDEVIALTKEWKNYAIERAKADALKEKQEALAKKTTQWLEAEAKAAKLEAEEEKARQKVVELTKRDIGNMDTATQQRFAERLGYSNVDALLASETGLQGATNLLGPLYTEQGWSSYGSSELNKAIGEYDSTMSSAKVATSEAREEADALKTEVEEGQKELAEYSSTLDDIVGSLSTTGNQADEATTEVEELNQAIKNLPNGKTVRITMLYNGNTPIALPKAKGDWSVPYDNMPALLHRGERVLTASQARQMDEGGSSIDVSALLKGLSGAIREGMDGAQVNSYLDSGAVNRHINDVTGQTLMARRFA